MSVLLLCTACLIGAPNSTTIERAARQAFEEAQVHYKLGRFPQALEAYKRAYELKPLPGFLLNIGQCHMELGDYDRAIFFYEGYLRESPKGEHRALASERLAEARRLLEQKQKAAAASPPVAPAPAPGSGAAPASVSAVSAPGGSPAGPAGQSAPPTAAAALDTSATVPPVVEPAPFYKRWWFWTAVAGGAALVAGGVIFLATRGGDAGIPQRDLEAIDARR